jgi:hypothetical protein
MKIPSASSLQIGMACPGSCSLPYVTNERRAKDADLGTRLHACIEVFYDYGANEAEATSIEENCHAEWMMISKSVFPVLNEVKTEQYFELDVISGLVNHLGKDAYENYSKGGLWIRGCADIVGRTESGVLFVGDWKTGFGLASPAKSNWQLIVTALSFLKESDVGVFGRIIRTRDSTFDEHYWTREELLAKSDELVEFVKSLSEGTNKDKLKTGEQCKFCKSWAFCPAQKTAIQLSAYAKEWNKLDKVDEQVIESAVENVRAMEDLSKKTRAKIREFIDYNGGSLTLSDGRVLIPGKTEGNFVRRK